MAGALRAGGGLAVGFPLWGWWAVSEGGYRPGLFLVGVVYLALAVAVLWIGVDRVRVTGAARWAVLALAGLCVWTLVSIVWADDRGAAEVIVGRELIPAALFGLAVVWRPTPRALSVGLAVFVLAAIAGGATAVAAAISDPSRLLDGRLVGPTDYVNASAALYAMGMLAALVQGARPTSTPIARGMALGAAAALAALLLLTQSRGASAAAVVALVVALLAVSGRVRLLLAAVTVAIPIALVLGDLMDVREVAIAGGDAASSLRSAVLAIGFAAVGAGGLGALSAWLERGASPIVAAPRLRPRASRRAGMIAVTVAVGAIAVAVVAGSGWLEDRWESFKTPNYSHLEEQQNRFGGDLGSNRYEYWRVAVKAAGDDPVLGAGAGNFLPVFLERRTIDHATIYAHSRWFGALAELGLVGLLLALTATVSVAVALLRAGRGGELDRWLTVAASLPWVYLLVHGSVDWVGAFPVVAGPAFGLAGAALGAASTERGVSRRGRAGYAVAIGLTLVVVVAAPLALAARLSDRGATTWSDRPEAALGDLERAAALDPLAAAPLVRKGVVAVDLRRWDVARDAFARARDRDRSAWYPYLQLGLLAARRGERAEAIGDLERALARNPRDAVARRALAAVRSGHSPDPAGSQWQVLHGER